MLGKIFLAETGWYAQPLMLLVLILLVLVLLSESVLYGKKKVMKKVRSP